eukprot:CAMPEP_0206487746 /NCGR_PEP_ID=MMETSP0324_2-20121206/41878_1 /ASSEMBLY_ACC=CAM_ASM_000836 /TAXON_ID=2866 /ORGANISM="Crypthecodinium cohnii, Strain Seligo" /LENGTH=62 /DNA_ID=CAMNT_0053966393 /DNA_START=175 /DNA_END=363 /DNA_ORIENTATION=-
MNHVDERQNAATLAAQSQKNLYPSDKKLMSDSKPSPPCSSSSSSINSRCLLATLSFGTVSSL